MKKISLEDFNLLEGTELETFFKKSAWGKTIKLRAYAHDYGDLNEKYSFIQWLIGSLGNSFAATNGTRSDILTMNENGNYETTLLEGDFCEIYGAKDIVLKRKLEDFEEYLKDDKRIGSDKSIITSNVKKTGIQYKSLKTIYRVKTENNVVYIQQSSNPYEKEHKYEETNLLFKQHPTTQHILRKVFDIDEVISTLHYWS